MEQDKKTFQDYDHLVVKRKFVSLIVAGLIILGLFAFLAGFFWGYRRASHDVQIGINKASFSDQISYSSLQLSPDTKLNAESIQEASDNIINQALVNVINQDLDVQGSQDNQDNLVASDDYKMVNDSTLPSASGYYAELIGFGRLKPAQLFVEKLKTKGYQVEIKKRVSKTGNGKSVNWYQIITQTYPDKQSLQKILDVIKKTQHLQGVKIKSI